MLAAYRTTKMLICILLVTSVPAFGVFLRSRSSTPFHNPVEKVKRLVLDIEESVRKSGEDSDSVFSTLQSYDKQLDNSLEQELGMLNQTLVRLLKMQTTYSMDMKSKNARSAHLRTAAKASEQMATHYEAGTADTRTGFDSLEDRTDMLVSVLRTAGVSPQGRLVTPEKPDSAGEPQLILSAIRRVLSSNPGLRFSHPEVFAAFLPSVANATAEPQELYPVVEMTPNLLQATIDTLVEIKGRLRSTKSQTLLQFGALHREFEQDALLNMAESNAQQGLEAENEQKAQEVTFSIKFTKAVIDMDQKFRQSVTDHVRSTSDLVYQIRDLREAQLKILHDVSIALNAQGASSMEGLSFLETTLDRSQPQDGFAALQSEVEAVTRNHGDTHDLLMQVKDMLEQQEPIDADGVQEVIREFREALQSVDADHSKSEEAKRQCESQKFHAIVEERTLKATLDVMSASRNHSQKAIQAAQANLNGIEKKSQALEKSVRGLAQISAEASASLEAQSRDRSTIVLAVSKASQLVVPSLHDGAATSSLMKSLIKDLSDQEEKEKDYRARQAHFQSEFARYVQSYRLVLAERRKRYESSLDILQLHVNELSGDLLAQQQTFATGQELKEQREDVCERVLRFHKKRMKYRNELRKALRAILPRLSTLLD